MNPQICYQKNSIMFCSIVGSFLIHLSLGGAYSFGDLRIYFNGSNYVYAMGMFGLSSSMGFGGFLASKRGPQKTMLLGSIIMNTGVLLTAVADNLSFLTYGLLCGSGAGLLFSVCLKITCQWFHTRIGSIIGVILSGFPLGSILVHILITHIPKLENQNEIFLYFGITFLLLQFLGILLLQKANDYQNEEEQHLLSINIIQEVPTHNMILEIDFWIIWLILALNSFGVIFLMQINSPGYISLFEQNISTIYTDYSFVFCGRIIWGCLSDYISMKDIFCTMSLGACFVYAIHILMSNLMFSLKYNILIKMMTSIMYIWISGNISIIFGLVIKRFGKKHYATNLGCIMTAYCISGIIASLLHTQVVYSDVLTFSIIAVMSFLAFVLALFYNGKPRQYSINITDIFSCFRCCI